MDLPIQSIDELRAAGRAAAEGGERRDVNPFPRYGSHYRQWEHGHVWACVAGERCDQEGS